MSISNVGLRKQINDWLFPAPLYTLEQLGRKEKRCDELFE